MKPLTIVIITYNRPEDVLRLLQNIAAQDNALELIEAVLVIDNNSDLDYTAVEAYALNQALPFSYIRSNENLGVARGRNYGISLSHAPIIVTIDDDAYFRDHTALSDIVELFAAPYTSANHIGAYCFKVLYASTKQLQRSAFPHKKMEKYQDREQFLTSYYIGCGHAILKEVYDRVGDYPADFFYGMEEYDLSYRILDTGFRIAYNNTVVILHDESPKGRAPHAQKMQMLWVNKSKVAFRYLPIQYFITTVLLWSLEFLIKTKCNLKLYCAGWAKIAAIFKHEKRKPIKPETIQYIKQVEGRMWY